jgi:sugar lactone lactonase YvrE
MKGRHTITIGSVFAVLLAMVLGAAPLHADTFPTVIPLPNGFEPEGIAMGRGATAYVGSESSGAIYKINLHTGEGESFVEAQPPQGALGMMMDPRTGYLYVAGGAGGNALVYDTATGELVQEIELSTEATTLVNDVAIGWNAVYFTDTHLPVFYKVPLSPGGSLPDAAESETIPISGEWENLPEGLNGNGIVVSADGKKLIIAHTDLGRLYEVDPASGVSTLMQINGEMEIYHDGLVLAGNILYVVNYNDSVYTITLAPDWLSGTLDRTITDPNFEAISTGARRGPYLYVVNARWDAERTPDTEYWVTRVKR